MADPYKIEVHTTSEQSPEIVKKIYDHVDLHFGPKSPDRHAHDHGEHYFSVSYKDVIATVDGEVISLVKLFKRDLVVEGFGTVVFGGLGDVSTVEKWRKQGISSKLIARGHEVLKADGCQISYLCMEKDKPEMCRYYSQRGYQFLNRPYTYIGLSGTRHHKDDGMIAKIDDNQEFYDKLLNSSVIIDLGVGNW